MIQGSRCAGAHQHQGVTRLAETERPGRTLVTVSEQVADGNGHSALAVELARLRAENARLLRLLNLTRQEASPPGPWQSGLFDVPPGLVHAGSPPEVKVALFAARTDVYAVRWENTRTGRLAGFRPPARSGPRYAVSFSRNCAHAGSPLLRGSFGAEGPTSGGSRPPGLARWYRQSIRPAFSSQQDKTDGDAMHRAGP